MLAEFAMNMLYWSAFIYDYKEVCSQLWPALLSGVLTSLLVCQQMLPQC